MKRSQKIKWGKRIATLCVILILIGICIYLFPLIKDISTTEGQIKFKEEVDQLGIWGILLLFGLQVAQIMLVVLPGEPLEILAGMCYGTVGGTIFIFISVFITTTLIFFLVRKYGKRLLYHTFNKEKIKKIENSKFFQNPTKIEIIFAILFLIPGTPKDLLVYIGGLLPFKPIRFILISTFVRFPSVISSTIAGDNIATGNWKMMLITYGITFLVTGIIIFIVNRFDKNKTTKEALDIIK